MTTAASQKNLLRNKSLGGVLLVAGTCIGAVTLALPVSTATLGLVGTLAAFAVTWAVMYLSGLLVLEVNLSLPAGSSFISMARETLGPVGEGMTWVCYLLLLYSLLAAYFSGGGDLVHGLVLQSSTVSWPHWIGVVPWVGGGALMLLWGVSAIDKLNRWLTVGLAVTFSLMVVLMTQHVHLGYLSYKPPRHILATLPVLITAFGYQVVVPSLRRYLADQVEHLPRVLTWGSVLPLIVYALWAVDMFGVVPAEGPVSLQALLHSGHPADLLPRYLATIIPGVWVANAVAAFVICAIASSFLGISLSLFDFLADGLPLKREGWQRYLLVLVTLVPPLVYTQYFPRGFMRALEYAGFFVALLNGLIPVAMAWMRRQDQKVNTLYRAPGGQRTLWVVAAFSLLVIVADILH